MALLLVNGGAVIVSAPLAAFLGLVLFAAVMILAGKRKWIVYFTVFLLMLALVPNPMRSMVVHSLRHDHYVFDRLDIWSMSARMFRAHPWTGVGPDLFSEAVRPFNFPKEKGPSRYGELPESPHSDYWKVITETGMAGLVFVMLFLFFAIRRMLAPPWSDPSKALLAFLLLQMLFFNLIFNFFFLIVLLVLLDVFFWRRLFFVSLSPAFKIFWSGLLLLIFCIFYLLPFQAGRLLQRAAVEKNIVQRFAWLNRAGLYSPLDERVPLARARILRGFFKSTANLEAWEAAWEDLRLAQKLNRNGSEACIIESGLFMDMLEKRITYPALAEEILAPLRRAEELEPFNPFLKLQQALILAKFDRRREARQQALAALEIEPDYVAAMIFRQRLSGSPAGDAVFQKRIAQIQARAKILQPKPGSYLYELYRLPARDITVN